MRILSSCKAVAMTGIATLTVILAAGAQHTVSAPVTDVRVTNTPDVHVTNGVTISSATPVHTISTDDPAKSAFAMTTTFVWEDGQNIAQQILTVPAGKRFVIEYLSADGSLQSGQHASYVRLAITTNGVIGLYTFPVQPYAAGGAAVFLASQSTHLYADPGTELAVVAVRDSNAGTGAGEVFVTGHLVNAS